jgi:YD repeat-containing protein
VHFISALVFERGAARPEGQTTKFAFFVGFATYRAFDREAKARLPRQIDLFTDSRLPYHDRSLHSLVTPRRVNKSVSRNVSYSGQIEATVWGVDATTSYAYSNGSNASEIGLYDANGDGLPDRVLRSGDENPTGLQVQANLFGGANLLKTVNRPLGGTIELQYQKNTPSEDDPHTRWLLTSTVVRNRDGYPAEFSTTPISMNFSYASPYYDRLEREFYGFESVRSIRPDGRLIETKYANRDYRLRGQVLDQKIEQVTQTANSEVDVPYEETETHFDPTKTRSPSADCLTNLPYALKALASTSVTPCDAWFADPSYTTNRHFEGGSKPKETTVHFLAYDNYGNVTKLQDDQDDGNADDLVALVNYAYQSPQTSTYYKELQDAHILNRVSSVDVRQGSDSGARLRFRQATYDSHGNMLTYEVFADAAGTKVDKMTLVPDSTGFVESYTDDSSGYSVNYTPEPQTYLFAKTTIDSFKLNSSAKYDPGFQLPTKQVDENGQEIDDGYDVFGRLSTVQGPYELAAGVNSLSVAYDLTACQTMVTPDPAKTPPPPPPPCTAPDSVTTTNTAVVPGSKTQSTSIRTAIFVDGLGRPIQTQMDAAVRGSVGRTISGKVEFDTSGHMIEIGLPSFASGTTISIVNTTLPADPKYYTSWQYDLLDRPLQITEPGSRTTKFAYQIGVNPRYLTVSTLTTQITDPDGKIRFEHRDAMGQLVAVVQKFNNRDLITTYDYSPTGELTTIDDANSGFSKFEYDLAGRRTAVTTPDTGRMELGYDAAGNLLEKTDMVLCPQTPAPLLVNCGNTQKIRYTYDKNRP